MDPDDFWVFEVLLPLLLEVQKYPADVSKTISIVFRLIGFLSVSIFNF